MSLLTDCAGPLKLDGDLFLFIDQISAAPYRHDLNILHALQLLHRDELTLFPKID